MVFTLPQRHFLAWKNPAMARKKEMMPGMIAKEKKERTKAAVLFIPFGFSYIFPSYARKRKVPFLVYCKLTYIISHGILYANFAEADIL